MCRCSASEQAANRMFGAVTVPSQNRIQVELGFKLKSECETQAFSSGSDSDCPVK
ncbi:hypothetical protein RISK_003128 [Rhodopirellula islandica]|uniref:Uncharacterized protein n=1 Tax=Rhodopirellula islandica TaxID=595434 RepID=A0A0J1BE79_RHOIS|nr:hypothetical protein RISK_003128 [Rhodopirellula islandica]